MKKEHKEKMVRILEAVFISGETIMIVAWSLFLVGFILGAIIF